jgi:ATP phosphoribosyltransferase regulatory subunit
MSAPGPETPPPEDVLAAIKMPFESFAKRYGAQWIDPPVLQPLSLLLDLTGEALRSGLILVSSGGEDLALRPDFTIPVVRAHIARNTPKGRYVYAGDAYRSPTMGKPAEFFQLGLEIYGETERQAEEDGAIIGLAFSAARNGGREDLQLHLGDVGMFRFFLTGLGLPAAKVERLTKALPNPRVMARELDRATDGSPTEPQSQLAAMLAGLPEAEAALMLEELWRLAGIQPVGGRAPAEIVHRLALRADTAGNPPLTPVEAELIRHYLAISDKPDAALDQAAQVAKAGGCDLGVHLDAWRRRFTHMGVVAGMRLSTAFARPFGYYDGFLFQVVSPSLGGDEAIAAGGRYDSLPARLGGLPGAVGCMVRPALAWRGA